jgi:hypothetical protein
MNKFLALIAIFCLFACSQSTSKEVSSNIWHFKAQNNNPQMDNNALQIISGYKALLNDYANMDTLNLKEETIQLAKLSDSLSMLTLSADTTIQMNWENGLSSLSGELQGVYMSSVENNNKELKMSMNMTAIQILQLLSDIGFKQRNIYIFKTKDDQFEDGLFWFGEQKKSINPFHKVTGQEEIATGLLQEMK